jgi:hypothetical protein
MRHWIVALAAAVSIGAVIMLLAAGDRGVSPDQRFVEEVCSTTLPSAREMFDVYDDAIHTRAAPGRGAGLTVHALAYRGTEIARQYRAEVSAISGPDTDAGRLAEGFLESDSRRAVQFMAEEERRARKAAKRLTLLQSTRGLDRVEFALVQAIFAMTNARFMAAQTGMLEAYEKAGSCTELDALLEENR